MVKRNKIKTPEWVLNGKKESKEKEQKLFTINTCPNCGSSNIKVVIGEKGVWMCNDCGYRGKKINKKKVTEKELIKYSDDFESPKNKKGEGVI